MVEKRSQNEDELGEVYVGKLSLVDLAGAERGSNNHNRGQRLIEGSNINKSLLALSNCINALSDQNLNPQKHKNIHIPYRDSKLTRLLKVKY
jgi:kinesin family member 18/19